MMLGFDSVSTGSNVILAYVFSWVGFSYCSAVKVTVSDKL